MEILDIGISDINDTLNIKFDDDADGYHSGGGGSLGMEMLMNDKRRSGNSGLLRILAIWINSNLS
jgi:hypothetical protein